jgi:hypothetical protein
LSCHGSAEAVPDTVGFGCHVARRGLDHGLQKGLCGETQAIVATDGFRKFAVGAGG